MQWWDVDDLLKPKGQIIYIHQEKYVNTQITGRCCVQVFMDSGFPTGPGDLCQRAPADAERRPQQT